MEEGHKTKLEFKPTKRQPMGYPKRKRNIISFNPIFNMEVKLNRDFFLNCLRKTST